MAEREIVLKNISKIYENGVCVVRNLNLRIHPKEFIIFVGPSGCGKSTTLRMIAGLEEISSGELWIGDMLANFLEPKERELSMVFQNYALYPNMNVYKNLAFSLEVRGVDKKKIDKEVHEVAQLLGLERVLRRRPKELSGGQRQRVAIGNAIIQKPDILLMDEPLSNLDAKLRGQMRVELSKLHKKFGNTIIYVTHDQIEAMTLGTRIVVMNKGEIQQVDTPKRLYDNPVNQFVASFIGSPAMNILETHVVRTKEGYAVMLGENEVLCEEDISQWIHELDNKDNLMAGIRPEIFLDTCKKEKQERGDLTDKQKLMVTITHKESLGNETILYFELANQSCSMKASAENYYAVGEKIPVWVDTAKIHLFDKNSGLNLLYKKRM